MCKKNPIQGAKFFSSITKSLLVTCFLMGVLSISACTDNRAPEEIVKERSQARLDTLRAGDFEKALSYATPAYQMTTTPKRYSARVAAAPSWINAVVDSVECQQADICDVRVMITHYMYKTKIETKIPLEEKWINVDDHWWIYQF